MLVGLYYPTVLLLTLPGMRLTLTHSMVASHLYVSCVVLVCHVMCNV